MKIELILKQNGKIKIHSKARGCVVMKSSHAPETCVKSDEKFLIISFR